MKLLKLIFISVKSSFIIQNKEFYYDISLEITEDYLWYIILCGKQKIKKKHLNINSRNI